MGADLRVGKTDWLAWLRLCRIPNVFTAVADVWMGYWFVTATVGLWPRFALLTGSTMLLYSAGMILNDLFDLEQDRRERPDRPLPSGRIGLVAAGRAGVALLCGGVILAWGAGRIAPPAATLPGRSACVAALLALAIVIYDRWAKRSWWGPVAMGTCRLLNVLLGMSCAAEQVGEAWLTYHPAQWCVAGGIGIYVAGITWFARTEAVTSRRDMLLGALVTMLTGIGLLGLFPAATVHWGEQPQPWRAFPPLTWWPLLAILALPLVRRAVLAIATPEPRRVQQVIKLSILSLIILDASVTFAARGPHQGMLVAALLVPALLLGRWFQST